MKIPDVSRVLPPSDLKQLKKARAVKRSFPVFSPTARSLVSTLQTIKPWAREDKLKHSKRFGQLTYVKHFISSGFK